MELKFEGFCKTLLALQKQFNETGYRDTVKQFTILSAIHRHIAENVGWLDKEVERYRKIATDKLLGKES